MSRAFDIATPFGRSFGPLTTSRTYRDRDGVTTVTETVTSRSRSRPVYEVLSPLSRTEYINSPPSTRVNSANSGRVGAGVVTSTSEYERGPDGRPSHFSSTVYKSPYGKTYRFVSHF